MTSTSAYDAMRAVGLRRRAAGDAYESSDDELYGSELLSERNRIHALMYSGMPLRVVLRVADSEAGAAPPRVRVSGVRAVQFSSPNQPDGDWKYLDAAIISMSLPAAMIARIFACRTMEDRRAFADHILGESRAGRDVPGVGRFHVLEVPGVVDLDGPADAPLPAAAPSMLPAAPRRPSPDLSNAVPLNLGGAPPPAQKRRRVAGGASEEDEEAEEAKEGPPVFASLSDEIARDHFDGYMPGEAPTAADVARGRETLREVKRMRDEGKVSDEAVAQLERSVAADAAVVRAAEAAQAAQEDDDNDDDSDSDSDSDDDDDDDDDDRRVVAAWQLPNWVVVRLEGGGPGVVCARGFRAKVETAGAKGRLLVREVLRRGAQFPELFPAGSSLGRLVAGGRGAVSDEAADAVFAQVRAGHVFEGVGRLVVRAALGIVPG